MRKNSENLITPWVNGMSQERSSWKKEGERKLVGYSSDFQCLEKTFTTSSVSFKLHRACYNCTTTITSKEVLFFEDRERKVIIIWFSYLFSVFFHSSWNKIYTLSISGKQDSVKYEAELKLLSSLSPTIFTLESFSSNRLFLVVPWWDEELKERRRKWG